MNIKSQKGSMILYVLIAMLAITAVAVGMFVTSANKQRTQLEAINEMQKMYDNDETPAEAYQRYIGGEIIPIYTAEQLLKVGNGETLTIDGKGYTFNEGCTYVLKSDITLEQNFKTVQDKIKDGDVTFEGQGHTITVVNNGEIQEVYTEYNRFQNNNFGYTGSAQTFIVPASGYYKIECWGASGSYSSIAPNPGKGAYVKGTIYLNNNDKLLIYVGEGEENKKVEQFNGGGKGSTYGYSGGGATDIRLSASLNDRILVAAGGAGADGGPDGNNYGNRTRNSWWSSWWHNRL